MRKIILKILIVLFFTPVLCKATTLAFFEDGTIDGGSYDGVSTHHVATVDMTAGSITFLNMYNSSTLIFHADTIFDAIIWDAATLNMEGGSLTNLRLFNSGALNLNSGRITHLIDGGGYSNLRINGGLIDSAQIHLHDYTAINIHGGNVNWSGVILDGYSQMNIYGGDVLFEHGAFTLNNNAEINVYYSSIIRHKPKSPIIGYHLLDGSEFMLDQFTQYEIDQINFVPEPATVLLFGLGGLLLRKRW